MLAIFTNMPFWAPMHAAGIDRVKFQYWKEQYKALMNYYSQK